MRISNQTIDTKNWIQESGYKKAGCGMRDAGCGIFVKKGAGQRDQDPLPDSFREIDSNEVKFKAQNMANSAM